MKTRSLGTNTSDAPSRAEIETLCILDAIGTGCYQYDLARRLGFSPELAAAVATSVEPLRDAGLVELRDGQVFLTEAGSAWLKAWRSIVSDRST